MILSGPQRKMLERLAAGDEVWTTHGRKFSSFWRCLDYRNGIETARWDTAHALLKLGFMENYSDEVSGRKYRISDAGRHVIGPTPSPSSATPSP